MQPKANAMDTNAIKAKVTKSLYKQSYNNHEFLQIETHAINNVCNQNLCNQLQYHLKLQPTRTFAPGATRVYTVCFNKHESVQK